MGEVKVYVMSHAEARKRALNAVAESPDGYRVKIEPPRRSLDQNAKFHALCSDLARQCVEWGGMPRTAEDWKVLLVSGHAVATGLEAELVRGLEGELVMLRESRLFFLVYFFFFFFFWCWCWCWCWCWWHCISIVF